jgi:hypothetical protein
MILRVCSLFLRFFLSFFCVRSFFCSFFFHFHSSYIRSFFLRCQICAGHGC